MSTLMIEALKTSAVMMAPFLIWFGALQIKKSIDNFRFLRAMKRELFEIIEKTDEVSNEIHEYSEVKSDEDIFLLWDIEEFLEDEAFYIDVDKYVSRYTEAFGTEKEFHTLRSKE